MALNSYQNEPGTQASKGGVPVSVLVVEDEVAVYRLLNAAFECTHFKPLQAQSISEATEAITRRNPDLILLDLGLPDGDGIEFIRRIRGWSSVPILVVSGHGDEERKVAALEAGADDFITKPFSVPELIARMKAALRRVVAESGGDFDPIVTVGELEIDRNARLVKLAGERIHLTPLEYKLLNFLASHEGRVVTHRQILSHVWGDEYTEETSYLRVYVGYLRKKLEANPNEPKLLLTEPRIGYRLGT